MAPSAPAASSAQKGSKASGNGAPKKQKSNVSSNGHHHRLDKFGFIVNMDAQGRVVDSDDESDHNANNQHKDIPTFAEYKTTQRREKKWGSMMGRWKPLVDPAKQIVHRVAVDPVRHLAIEPATKLVRKGMPKTTRKASSNTLDQYPLHNTSASSLDLAAEFSMSVPPGADVNGHRLKLAKQVHRRKVITRLRKGVPDHIRGQVWKYLARVPQRQAQYPGLYQACVDKAIQQHEEATTMSTQQKQPSFSSLTKPTSPARAQMASSSYLAKHHKSFKNIQDTIERDIHRTYPRHHLFYDAEASGDDDDDDDTITDDSSPSAKAMHCSSETNTKGTSSTISTFTALQQQIPPLRRSHSPQELPSPAFTGSTAMTEDDLGKEEKKMPFDNDNRETRVPLSSPANFCGNEEISNMIRELEGVVGTTTAAPGTEYLFDDDIAIQSLPSLLDQGGKQQNSRRTVDISDATGGQASLRRVLKAYSVYDREVGYCQGMNFVAGLFLTIGLNEEEAFWLLVYVMNDEPCRMRGLFGEGMRETHMVLHVAERLIQQYLPKISQQLEREHVHITMFATQWLLTQYTSSFRFDLVTRVWDAFLGEGWKMTYRVMLAILKLHEATIVKSSFEEILTLFREFTDSLSGSAVMDMALKLPLQRKSILKYEQEYYEQMQQQQKQAAAAAAAVPAPQPSKKMKPKNGHIPN